MTLRILFDLYVTAASFFSLGAVGAEGVWYLFTGRFTFAPFVQYLISREEGQS